MSLPSTAIAVIFGGPSAEHDVSLVSGRAIASALSDAGHTVSGRLVDLSGGWWELPADALDPALETPAFRDPAALGAVGPMGAAAALERLAAAEPQPVVFPAIHGTFGEDGQLQALLESVDLVYGGAGPAASAVGMDKSIFKRVCGSLELPVLPWSEIRAAELAADPDGVITELATFGRRFPDPRLVVKPARLGSSIGITILHDLDDRESIRSALESALRYDDLVIIEPYLDHPRELETSVLGNTRVDAVAFGPGEIVPGREFYDYVAKYESDESETIDEAELEPQLAADIRAAAVEVFLAIGATGFARVDMLLSADGIPYISEINTIPGFTPISLFPRMTASGGYDFVGTCERIVELALARAAARRRPRLEHHDLP